MREEVVGLITCGRRAALSSAARRAMARWTAVVRGAQYGSSSHMLRRSKIWRMAVPAVFFKCTKATSSSEPLGSDTTDRFGGTVWIASARASRTISIILSRPQSTWRVESQSTTGFEYDNTTTGRGSKQRINKFILSGIK